MLSKKIALKRVIFAKKWSHIVPISYPPPFIINKGATNAITINKPNECSFSFQDPPNQHKTIIKGFYKNVGLFF
jgi:hypothetical protein